MERIKKNGIQEVLNIKALEEKIPFLGICLGMQLLTNGSQEGSLPGLGWIDAEAIKFPESRILKVPHIGWNEAKSVKSDLMVRGLLEDSRFYFVHSYFVKTNNNDNSLMKTKYGVTFDSAISKANIYGFQFHPEKSHKYGMKILKNFSEI
jgi:glutamine amidotransferase